jgi:hypothetical protein
MTHGPLELGALSTALIARRVRVGVFRDTLTPHRRLELA